MKKILPILCVLCACSSTETTNNYNMNSQTQKQKSPSYRVYQHEVDAFACDKTKKGNFTYCDVDGEKITGFVKSKGNYISYYEDGEQLNGIIFYPDSQNVKNYFKKSADGNKFTLITYYKDGSVLSKEIDDKNTGKTEKTYLKGQKQMPYYDEAQINILIEAFNN